MNFKNCIGLIIVTLFSLQSPGQVNWYWTRQSDSADVTAGYDAVDRNNNPCYTGYFDGSGMSFGNIGGISNLGLQSDFLVKYTTNGVPSWARNATALTGSAETYGMAVATDRNNSILETGYFTDSIAFGAYHLSSLNRPYNSYVVKYNSAGTVQWAKCPNYYQNATAQANYVGTDNNSNVFVTGNFSGSLIFGRDTITSSQSDAFLVKYDKNGNVLWVKAPTLGINSDAYSNSVAIDEQGNSYIAGNFDDTVYFGNIKIFSVANTTNVYLAKYDPAGNPLWALNIQATPGGSWPTPVTVDKTGNVYIASQFNNPSLTIGNYTITDLYSPCSNSLLAKFDHNGNPLWATCANNISNAEVCVIVESSIATDHCNNVYWSGACSDTFAVGNVKITVPNAYLNQSTPFSYIIKLDSTGNPIGGAGLANQSTQYFSNGIAIDSLSRAYFDAVLQAPSTLVIGNDTVNQYQGESTPFISKFSIVPVILNSNNNDTVCPGNNAVLKVPHEVGTTYLWSTGATTDSIIIHPLVNSKYYVVISGNCNRDTSFITVNVHALRAFVTTNNDSICRGDSTLLTGNGGLSYHWSNGATTSTIEVAPLQNITYTMTAINGVCSKDTTITVHIETPVTATVSAHPDTICATKESTIKATAGGPATYRWSNGGTHDTIMVHPLVTTTYTALVYNRCDTVTLVQTITVNPLTTETVTALHDTICPSVPNTLMVSGTGGYGTYRWSTGATSTSINVNDTATNTYTVTAYGICDSVQKLITIHVIPLPQPVINGTNVKCQGTKDTIFISGGKTYLWNNGSTKSTYYTGDIEGDSTIYVTLKNSAGCPVKDSFKISEINLPVVTFTAIPTICAGKCITLTPSINGSGYTYTWSTGANSDTITVCPDSTTHYSLSVSNGCITKKSTWVNVFPVSLFVCCDTIITKGDKTTLTANNAENYRWTPSLSLNCDTCHTVVASPTVTTTYTITGLDTSGCLDVMTLTVVVEIPCFNFIIPNVFTPNSDGLNDAFVINANNPDGYSIIIYDRWGKEMYKSSDPTQYWNGNTEGGAKASDGVYYYIITSNCQGKNIDKQGFVQLVR